MSAEMLELCVLTAVLAQDTFWLMDRLSDRVIEAMRMRWHQLADELRWPCRYCGAVGAAASPCEWRDLYN